MASANFMLMCYRKPSLKGGRKMDENKLLEQKKKIEEQRQKAEQKVKALQAKMRRIDSKLKGKERKEDDRRKILAGVLLLERIKTNDNLRQWFEREINGFLVRPHDRALFGLDATKDSEE